MKNLFELRLFAVDSDTIRNADFEEMEAKKLTDQMNSSGLYVMIPKLSSFHKQVDATLNKAAMMKRNLSQ